MHAGEDFETYLVHCHDISLAEPNAKQNRLQCAEMFSGRCTHQSRRMTVLRDSQSHEFPLLSVVQLIRLIKLPFTDGVDGERRGHGPHEYPPQVWGVELEVVSKRDVLPVRGPLLYAPAVAYSTWRYCYKRSSTDWPLLP